MLRNHRLKWVVKIKYSPALKFLNKTKTGILSAIWLRQRNLNITNQFLHIIKVFEDFKLMAQLRKEIERVKNPALALAVNKE